jgi:PAS domain S-box-containing protein
MISCKLKADPVWLPHALIHSLSVQGFTMKRQENPNRLSTPADDSTDSGHLFEDEAFEILDLIRFKTDSSLRFLFLDNTFEALSGFAASEFLDYSRGLFDIVLADDRDIVKDALTLTSPKSGYFSAQFRIVSKTGTTKWIWMRGPRRDAGHGTGYYIQGVLSDISVQKELEQALHAEREFFRTFTDTLDDGICIISDDCTIRHMNRSLIGITGNHVGEVCYKALFNREGCCVLPEGTEEEQHHSCGFREHSALPDSRRTFQVRSLPMATSSGFKGRVGQFRDISRLKKTEHKFREFAVRVRAIARAANMADLGIFILVDQDDWDARIRFVNHAFSRITGYTNDELLNMSIFQIIHSDDLEKARSRYRRRLQGERMSDTYEIKLTRKDQLHITVFFMGALSIYHGKTATVGFVRDITLRKQLQESLTLSQRLASIGKLSAEIAHEINNPLTSVLTFNKLIEKIIQQQPFPVERIPELQEYVRFVNNEAGRCADIARNLLNFSRTAEIRIKENNLHEILSKTIDILRHRAEMNNITINTRYSLDVPPVHCDFSRIQQAFMNILWNAIEAMPHGGVLSISTEYASDCRHICKSGKNMIQVTISDTGIGIPKENLDRIFEPFFSTKKEKSGVGLGLSVAYGIIRKHNGQIQVQSEAGIGTSFTIRLPSDICTTCTFTDC